MDDSIVHVLVMQHRPVVAHALVRRGDDAVALVHVQRHRPSVVHVPVRRGDDALLPSLCVGVERRVPDLEDQLRIRRVGIWRRRVGIVLLKGGQAPRLPAGAGPLVEELGERLGVVARTVSVPMGRG